MDGEDTVTPKMDRGDADDATGVNTLARETRADDVDAADDLYKRSTGRILLVNTRPEDHR